MAGSRQRGLTLLELLVALLIAGVLAAVAIPSWQSYRARAERTEARAWLIRLANDQEAHFIRHGRYADSMQAFGFPDDTAPTPEGRYRLSILDVTETGYRLRATREATDREAARCRWFELDQSQHRSSGPDGPDVCWWR